MSKPIVMPMCRHRGRFTLQRSLSEGHPRHHPVVDVATASRAYAGAVVIAQTRIAVSQEIFSGSRSRGMEKFNNP